MQEKIHSKVILTTIVAALAFACMNFFVKLAQVHSSYQLVIFARFLIASIILLPFISFDKKLTLKTSRYSFHLLRACTGFLTVSLLILSLKYLSVVESTLLFMTYPLFVPILFFFIKKESLSVKILVSLLIGFFGIFLILNPDTNHISSNAWIGLAAGFMGAVGILITSSLGKTEPARRTVFYFSIHATIFAFILLTFTRWHMPSYHALLLLIAMGGCGLLYQQCLSYALRHCHPVLVIPIMYCSVIFGGLLDWIMWHEVPNDYALLGYFLVISGAVLTVWFKNRNQLSRQQEHVLSNS